MPTKKTVNGKKINKKKKTPNRRVTQFGQRIPDRGAAPSMALARTLTDPFNYTACIPDGARNKSCFTVRQMFTLATGAAGSAVSFAMLPCLYGGYFIDTGSSASTFTIGGSSGYSNVLNAGTINSLYAKIRVISMGLKLEYTGSDLANQGILGVCQCNGGLISNTVWNGQTLANMPNASCNGAFKIGSTRYPLMISWRPEDVEDYSFLDTNTPLAVNTSYAPGLPWLFAGATGLGNATPVMVTAVWNCEGQVNQSSFNPGNTTASLTDPIEPGWFEKAANITRGVSQVVGAVGAGLFHGATAEYPLNQPRRNQLLIGN